MTNEHRAAIMKGDGINPPPYHVSITNEQLCRDAIEVMSRVSETIPTNELDTAIFDWATNVLRKYGSKHETQSRRLEYEYSIKLYSHAGLTPPES